MKRYSSGMYVRLAFSVAAHLEPEIMLWTRFSRWGRRVPAPLPRQDGGVRERGPHRAFVSYALVDRTALRPGAQIDGGMIVQDGPPAEVIANYLHQTHSAGDERTWTRSTRRPGNDLVRIVGVRVLPHEGMPPRHRRRPPPGRDRDRVPCPRARKPVFPKIKVLDRESTIAFNAMDTDERWLEPTPPGSTRRPRGFPATS